jgi:hypothetical protein
LEASVGSQSGSRARRGGQAEGSSKEEGCGQKDCWQKVDCGEPGKRSRREESCSQADEEQGSQGWQTFPKLHAEKEVREEGSHDAHHCPLQPSRQSFPVRNKADWTENNCKIKKNKDIFLDLPARKLRGASRSCIGGECLAK